MASGTFQEAIPQKGDSAQKSDRIFGSEMAGCGQRKREKNALQTTRFIRREVR